MSQKEAKLICCVIEKGEEDLSIYQKNQLALVPYRDIAAVVHELEDQSWKKMSKEELNSRLLWYQKVNVDLLRHCTMIPLRFGNIAPDTQNIKQFLSRTYLHLKSALNGVTGKAEFVVQLSWNLKAALQEIAQGWKSRLDSSTPVESGKVLFEAAKEKRKVLINTVHQGLFPLAVNFTDGKRTDESILMNRSYLIDKEKEPLFDKAMEKLGRENQAYITFRYIGPIPAYSFVPLEFDKGNFELIDKARKILGLPQKSSLIAIKASYRKLSLEYHPDRNPDQSSTGERFKRITQAYDILRTYSCSLGKTGECSFAKRDVEKTFIVK
jgi:hypothetical protein